ncbi:hypothetical protein IMW82_13795 [Rhodanobacter sp. B2A1Ga4]|jgi:hypothetical protein|uniref:hypothetical protein n=1 Tax=Rhodanobacter sp. B2A1Ga4 TaxID=2778647 RepID=UPI001B37EB7E|nr:hypothetical protein [Rhodanobacter sp. B2A1Ga4]MBQ4855746.1 hypothetical protein [Rhodanobacter sp. B2A1Ga4]
MDSNVNTGQTSREIPATRITDSANKGEAWAQAHAKSIRVVTWLLVAGMAVLWFVKHH